ncbi:A24 family peptidase [Clostridioides difficile]|nr:A24 family peptidase [Clostridioides difficile]HBF2930475.1 prepilin peptidase [Clostridioides difficile]HBF2935859.1 prepilin peptidase [Clostridioides difficile]HBZ0282655.1 prepilin peptidase [Clostridioides difficile]
MLFFIGVVFLLFFKVSFDELKKYNYSFKVVFILSILLVYSFIRVADFKIDAILYSCIIPVLVSISYIDLKVKEIPDKLIFIIYIYGLFLIVVNNNYINHDIFILNNLCSSFSLFSIYLVIAIITNGVGGGDIKLMGALGLFFNTSSIFKLLVYPVFLGVIMSVFLIVLKKAKLKDNFPLGPAISISACLIFLINYI